MKSRIVLLLVYSWICSCNNNNAKNDKNPLVVFTKYGRFLIKESYGKNGKLYAKQFFNKDTIPDGGAFEYYPNGKLSEWQWFSPADSDTLAHCVVEYKPDGVFDTFMGRPFVSLVNKNDSVCYVLTVSPPNINYIVILVEIDRNGKKIAGYRYEPEITDTTGWVEVGGAGESLYKTGRFYYMEYYIIDSSRKRLYQIPIDLKIVDSNKYRFVDVAPYATPLSKLKKIQGAK